MQLALRIKVDGFRKEYYVIKDGEIVGELKQSYRPKSCGGTAWEYSYKGRHGVRTCFYHSKFEQMKKEIRSFLTDGTHKCY